MYRWSPHPQKRWVESQELRETSQWSTTGIAQQVGDRWPDYWFGAVNAWLVFLGPSPGNSPDPKQGDVVWELPTIGEPSVNFAEYHDTARFRERIRAWTSAAYSLAEVFPQSDRRSALGSALLANVVPSRAGRAKDITDEQLRDRMGRVLDIFEEVVQPGLVVTLEKRVSRILRKEYMRRGSRVVGSGVTVVPAKNQPFPSYKPHWYNLQTVRGHVLIAESPQHPSHPNFFDMEEVESYLAAMVRMALDTRAQTSA